jgi:hypothetical protein
LRSSTSSLCCHLYWKGKTLWSSFATIETKNEQTNNLYFQPNKWTNWTEKKLKGSSHLSFLIFFFFSDWMGFGEGNGFVPVVLGTKKEQRNLRGNFASPNLRAESPKNFRENPKAGLQNHTHEKKKKNNLKTRHQMRLREWQNLKHC